MIAHEQTLRSKNWGTVGLMWIGAKSISKVGLILVAAYAALSLASWFYAASIRGDEEAKFLVEVLPIVPALVVIDSARLTPTINQLPDTIVTPILYIGSMIMIYSVGWLVGQIGYLIFLRNRRAH